MRGLHPILARMEFQDRVMSISCDIRVRKFYSKSRKDFMYCAYAVTNNSLIDVSGILNRTTAGNWRSLYYNRDSAKSVSYYTELDGARMCMDFINDKINTSAEPITRENVMLDILKKRFGVKKVSFKVFPVTQEQVDKAFAKSEENKIIRKV